MPASLFPDPERLSLVHGFGRATRRAAYVYRPTTVDEIARLLEAAADRGFTVGLHGAARSYGDAPLNGGHVVLDLRRMNRVLDYDPEHGVITVQPGVTIRQLWQHTLEDGWWPAVVPGTSFPTIGGCLGMNVHGKNNWKAGTFGEHVLRFTALLPTGEEVTCTPDGTPDLFHAIISGAGVLGVITSATIQLKRVHSGELAVEAWTVSNLAEHLQQVDAHKEDDYIVGWLDSTARGRALGRGQLHRARYLAPGEDPHPHRTLRVEHQTLPENFFGLIPASIMWRLMAPWMHPPGVWAVNTAKYWLSALGDHKCYRQPHVAFHFLLDYIPNWRLAYGREGLIQYQCFIPKENAWDAFGELLRLTHRRGLPSYLAVVKRHRPDGFLFSHAVDGFSLALDFKVTRRNRARLQALADDLNRIVLQAGGRFYFAKDSTLTPEVVAAYLGEETLARFRALKQRCDPAGVLANDLYRRLLQPLL